MLVNLVLFKFIDIFVSKMILKYICLLYTSDAADD